MPESDSELIGKYRAGDAAAFSALYDKYAAPIYRFVYYKVFAKEAAEDIVSDVFFKALERLDTYDESRGSFSAWLYSVARNAVTDHYRTTRPNGNIDDYFDLGEDARIEEAADARRVLEKVSQYLETLSPKQREIVTLRIWQGLSYKEIADIVGGTEAASKMAFSRAIADIRDKFGAFAALVLLLWRP